MAGAVSVAVFPPATGATNFALDEALAARAALLGRRLIRVYGWSRPTVSFGRNEAALKRFSAERFAAVGVDVVRRPTGGRALVHHRELTYAVAGPVVPGETAPTRFAEVQQILTRALRLLGVEAEIAAGQRYAAGPNGVCFSLAAPGEIVVSGQKLVASAQFQSATAWLQHGSILLDNDQPLLDRGLEPGAAPVPLTTPATLTNLIGAAPSPEAFADTIAAALGSGMSARVNPDVLRLDPGPFLARFTDAEWTWRR